MGLTIRIAGKDEKPPLHLETVLIEPDEQRLGLTWRGSVHCDKKALQVEQVTIDLVDMDFVEGGA
jgi:hypothetical protein